MKIEHYRRGKRVSGDAFKRMDGDVAQRQQEAQSPSGLVPFHVSCPGSVDGACSGERRTWSCSSCEKPLQFCLVDHEVYCGCAHSRPDQFRFRCRSDGHGEHFLPSGDEALQEMAAHHALNFYTGDYFITGPYTTAITQPVPSPFPFPIPSSWPSLFLTGCGSITRGKFWN